ncbi:ComEC/Rec2 family competence protein [Desulfovibrio cuneatus]|uniref:ComEC/Rec2 family competence protein n=1 Tax=Desulfovibrio cuneatus TaxID=159728 RepID=UPI000420DB5B|nr:ComEC/Rec2 family competence protein [Desulfovibrio cuneatus]
MALGQRTRQTTAPRLLPPAFLLRQWGIFAFLAGIVGARFPAQGFFALAIILCGVLWQAWQRAQRKLAFATLPLLMFMLFGAGAAYTFVRTPQEPPLPQWVQEHFDQWGRNPFSAPKLHLTGRVEQVIPRPEGKVQLILTQLAPVESIEPAEPVQSLQKARSAATSPPAPHEEPYTGLVQWTGQAPTPLPLEGQYVQAPMTLSPIRGFANPHSWNPEGYWFDQNVWLRATSSAKAIVQVTGQPNTTSRLRQQLVQQTLGLLPRAPLAAPEGTVGTLNGKFTPTEDIPPLLPGATLLPALLFGDRSFIAPEHTERINQSTLAHSLALSGLHLGYALLLGFCAVRAIAHVAPRIYLWLPRPVLSLLLGLPVALLYLWLGGAPLSLLRAFCMFVGLGALFLLRRPACLYDGLLLALAGIALWNPLALFASSLQLSALSIAAIALYLPLGQAVANRLFPQQGLRKNHDSGLQSVGKWAFYLLFTTCTIQLVMAPVLIATFGSAGVWLPLNLIWLPLLGTLIMPLAFAGLAATALGLSGVATFCLHLASLPCTWLLALLERMDNAGVLWAPLLPRPHWLFIAGWWALCASLPFLLFAWVLRPRATIVHAPQPGAQQERTRAGKYAPPRLVLLAAAGFTLCLAGVLLPLSQRPTGVQFTLLDVGHAQAALIEWHLPQASGRALIDGGIRFSTGFDQGKQIVAPVLTYAALPRLDAVINTHADADHLGGLVYLLQHFQVGRFLKTDDAPNSYLQVHYDAALRYSGLSPVEVSKGNFIPLAPGLGLEVLWPEGTTTTPSSKNGRNDRSLALRLVWEGTGLVLLCGDLSTQELDTIASTNPVRAQALVLPHHGAGSALAPALYAAASPRFALVSARHVPSGQFAHRTISDVLQEMHIPLYATAKTGAIGLHFTAPTTAPVVTTTRQEHTTPANTFRNALFN